jgi:hypothetical protein
MSENIEGPVPNKERVPHGTRVQLDVPLKTWLAINGTMFCLSGYSLYHTFKALATMSKETPVA